MDGYSFDAHTDAARRSFFLSVPNGQPLFLDFAFDGKGTGENRAGALRQSPILH